MLLYGGLNVTIRYMGVTALPKKKNKKQNCLYFVNMFKLYLLCGCYDDDNPDLSVCNISAVWDDMLRYFDDDIIYVERICLLFVYL